MKLSTRAQLGSLFCLFCSIYVQGTKPPVTFKAEGRFQLDIGEGIQLTFPNNRKGLVGHIESSTYRLDGPFQRCVTGRNESDICLQWGEFVLNITARDDACTLIEHSQPSNDESENVACFNYGEAQWFGGPERWYQDWPVQKIDMENMPFIPGFDWTSVSEPFWFNSDGISIHVKPEVPLFVDSNKKTSGALCLTAKVAEPYLQRDTNLMRWEFCHYNNAVEAQKNAVQHYFGKPSDKPNDAMFRDPIYSTWVRYGRDINQDKLQDLVREIQDHSFPVGQIEIDDIWEPCYGASQFDTNRFPNIKEFTDYVHGLGGRATAWIYPFVNEGCNPSHQEAIDKGYFVKSESGEYLVDWWCGTGGAVDFTKPEAAKWYVDRLDNLRSSSGLDSFKFDAGETTYLPSKPQLSVDVNVVPGIYVRKYVEAISQFKGVMEVRVGRNSQDFPTFVRMMDKDSRFGLDNGLQSVITGLFQISLVGYPFVLPDMIGGNAYGNEISKELFIRWLQASTFMPALQFSKVPWDFDDETVEISRKFLALHQGYTPMLIAAAEKAVSDGTPINAPIWWIAPEDQDALKCRDEYLFAEKVLVAPIVEEGATSRDIYLPKGTWLDQNQKRYDGPTWLRGYSAPLDTLPYFTLTS